MKKTKTFLTLVAFCLVAVFALCACSFQFEETDITSSDELEGSLTLLEEFFEGTLNYTNQVVNVTSGNAAIQLETINRDKCSVETPGYKQYVFVKDGEYILAIEAEKAYQVIDKSDYDQCRYTWKNFLPLGMTEDDIKDAEAEGVTASITITASGSGSITQSSAEVEIKSTCTFTLQSKEGSETLEAHAINGLVTDVTYTMNANGNTSMLNFAFTYDNAYVDIPDLTKWKAGGEQGGGNETEGTND